MLRCVKALRLPLSTQYIRNKFTNIVPTDAFRIPKYISPTVTYRRISSITMTSLKEDKTGKKIVTQVNGEVNVKVTRSSVTEVEKNWRDYYLNLKLEEKRKVYHCGSKFVVPDKIQPWPEYAPTIKVKVKRASKPLESVDDNLNKKISLWRGDITKLEIDAIVNAANSALMGGGGVDGAIHRGAGKKLMEECSKLNGCPTGNAKLTGGYKLPARYVIHTVGPIGENAEMLAKCYRNCLDIAQKYDIKTVAFPCISTGIYGYDVENATPVVMETVRKWLQEGDNAKCIDNIIFCVFLTNDVAVYESNLLQNFPVDKTDTLDSLPDKKRPKTSGEENTAAGEGDETKENVEVNDKSKDGIKDKQTDVEKLKDSDKKQKETERSKTITKL